MIDELAKNRFWGQVDKTGPCYVWTGARIPQGYGYIGISGKSVRAHRVSWEIHNGEIPDGLWVLHRCDNPSCVRPDHLFLGTNSDNMNDCASKGRMRLGEKHHKAKLSWEKVEMIRSSTKTQKELAKEFGVCQATVWSVLAGESWKYRAPGK